MIASVRLPYLVSSIEGLHNPPLVEYPFVIGGQPTEGGTILAVSEKAASYGIKVGMKRHQAKALCPKIKFVHPHPARYQRYRDYLEETLAQFSTHVEAMPSGSFIPQHWYLDIHQLSAATCIEVMIQIGQHIYTAIQLPSQIGVAQGKFSSQIAATAIQANQALMVRDRQASSFLAPFPIRLLPLNADMARRLPLFGLRTIGQLAALPRNDFVKQFGKIGEWVHHLACGDDPRPVQAYQPHRSITRYCQWDTPIDNRLGLNAAAQAMVDELTAELQAAYQFTSNISLEMTFEDHKLHEDWQALRHPSDDHTYLYRQVMALLDHSPIQSGVVAVRLRLGGLTQPIARQPSLFDEAPVANADYQKILQHLVQRHGDACFYQVRLVNPQASILERGFRLGGIDPV